MSINIGIIGLPQSGKTTIFHALTGAGSDTAGHAADSLSPHVGISRVPDPRLDVLDEMFHPRKKIAVEIRYVDVGASLKSLVQDKGIGGELLNQLNTVDTLITVVRAFPDDTIPHPEGSIDVKRDIAALNLELIFSDLAILERRLERIENSLKGAKPAERQSILHEKESLLRLKTEMDKDIPVRELPPGISAPRALSAFQFLTAKPLLIVVNIGEDQLPHSDALEKELNEIYSGDKCRVIALCGELEMELARLDDAAAAEFRDGYGLAESGAARIIRASFELSDLISFFTTASNEVRAWSIKRGTTAVRAAGKIHTDMEKGFIRAERISYEDLVDCGSIAEARKQGRLHLEGKEYIVQDGDVITFLFNV
jgi:GTP-binding protein YchF